MPRNKTAAPDPQSKRQSMYSNEAPAQPKIKTKTKMKTLGHLYGQKGNIVLNRKFKIYLNTIYLSVWDQLKLFKFLNQF